MQSRFSVVIYLSLLLLHVSCMGRQLTHAHALAVSPTDALVKAKTHALNAPAGNEPTHAHDSSFEELPQNRARAVKQTPATTNLATSPLKCMYECQRKDWAGQCKRTEAKTDVCFNRLFSGSETLGPDKGLICTLYKEKGCKGESRDGFEYPGWSKDWSVDPYEVIFTEAPRSWRCRVK